LPYTTLTDFLGAFAKLDSLCLSVCQEEITLLPLDGLAKKKIHLNMMYVWPCIIYENDGRYQLDATVM